MPSFGVRSDGTIVVGYLSASDVTATTNPFVQLISGVVWLVRNGSSFVADSIAIESLHPQLQEFGAQNTFARITTGHTAIGHDANGVVKLFQFDGISWETGYVCTYVNLIAGMGSCVCRLSY